MNLYNGRLCPHQEDQLQPRGTKAVSEITHEWAGLRCAHVFETTQQTRLINCGEKLDLIPAVEAQEVLAGKDYKGQDLSWVTFWILTGRGGSYTGIYLLSKLCQSNCMLCFSLWHFANLIFCRMMIDASHNVMRVAVMSITQMTQSLGLFYWFQNVLLSKTWYQPCQALWQSHPGSIHIILHTCRIPFVSG